MPGVRFGQLEIFPLVDPFFRLAGCRLAQIPKDDLGAQGRAKAFSELPKSFRRSVALGHRVTGKHLVADGTTAGPVAFYGKKRDFMDWIENAEISIELETINVLRRWPKMDVLWSQIAVALDNPSIARSAFD